MATTILMTHAESVRVLIEQTRSCTSASWAVAWATPNKVFDAAIARMEVFKHFIVGTHGSQTHPKCLRALAGHRDRAFIRRSSSDLFHPKIYMFEHADKYSVVIGSHNLTRGAFESNEELSILTDFDKKDPSVKQLLDWMEEASQEKLCVVYTTQWMSEYDRLYELARQKRKEIDRQRTDAPSRSDTEHRERLPINLTWDAFYEQLSRVKSPSHDVERRLVMLDYMANLFSEFPSFSAMPKEDRVRIAGLTTKKMVGSDEIDWNHFGSMKGALMRPDFKALVVDAPEEISAAIERIPLTGPVNETHWDLYWTELRHLDDDRGSLAGGLATRIAALRRPDVFVSVNRASKHELARLLGTSVNSLRASDYWKRVIQAVQRTRWYVAEEPHHPHQARVWRARAALLDSLAYKP